LLRAEGLEQAEQENGWPARAGKMVLQIALTRRGLRHWGSEDYRPTLDAWKQKEGEARSSGWAD
jgi:hypothetical protein